MSLQLNEERTAVGKGPVGFVNPVLYANPDVLNDIVNGTNLGCDSHGFQAVKGYVCTHVFISITLFSSRTPPTNPKTQVGSCDWSGHCQLSKNEETVVVVTMSVNGMSSFNLDEGIGGESI